MAIIVEDGTVVAGANSYVDIPYVDVYTNDLGLSWTGSATDKERAIKRGMRYLEGLVWEGTKTNRDNPLEWPRYDVTDKNGYCIDSDVVPEVVKKALCEASVLELATPGILQPNMGSADGKEIKREKVDVLETEYFEGQKYGKKETTQFTIILDLLTGLLSNEFSGAFFDVVRT